MTVSQTEFRAGLLDPKQPVPTGLTDASGAPAGKRFDVYRNNVAVSLTEALETGFPVIRKLVGDEFFKAMTGVYLRANPPASPLMSEYGATFPRFLKWFQPVRHLPYLPDVARLELGLRRAYHAADAPVADAAVLGTVGPDQLATLRLHLAPAVEVQRSPYPVASIWSANMRGTPHPGPGAEDVLIVRPDYDPEPVRLSPGGADFIDSLLEGKTFAAALGRATAAAPGFDLSSTLGQLIAGQAITRIEVP